MHSNWILFSMILERFPSSCYWLANKSKTRRKIRRYATDTILTTLSLLLNRRPRADCAALTWCVYPHRVLRAHTPITHRHARHPQLRYPITTLILTTCETVMNETIHAENDSAWVSSRLSVFVLSTSASRCCSSTCCQRQV